MVPSVGGVVVSLLIYGEVHVSYLLFPSQVCKVSGCLACARGAFMRSVEPTGKTVPPIVLSFHGMKWVIAWALCLRVVASSAPTSIVAIVAVAASVWLWIVGLWWLRCGEVRVGDRNSWRWGRHGGWSGRYMVDLRLWWWWVRDGRISRHWRDGLISWDGGRSRRNLDGRWNGVDRSGLCVIDELAKGGDLSEESLEGQVLLGTVALE